MFERLSRPKDNDSVTVELCYNESMKPGKYNIVCPQGSTLVLPMDYSTSGTLTNLSAYTARMQVRETHESETATLTLTTENGGIVLSGTSPNIRIKVSASLTTPLKAKTYVYDLELVDTIADPYRIMEGDFIVTREVTR